MRPTSARGNPVGIRFPATRLDRQLISRPRFATPAEVVGWFGAVQAQDYLASLWAVGLRLRGSTEAMIEAAIAEGRVIRTHTLRGMLQLVAREDVRWMLALVGRRVLSGSAGRFRQLELDAATLARADQSRPSCGREARRKWSGTRPRP